MASARSPSTPVAAGTPPSIAPAPSSTALLAIKTGSAGSPGPLTPASITSKEWVVPPRPKPGRKPAIDTPPTKRKAQNRAAQRAFRERRAARVGELEEQLKQIEEENEAEQMGLRDQISKLNTDLEVSKGQVEWWRARCMDLERDLETGTRSKEKQNSVSLLRDDGDEQTTTVPLQPRRSHRHRAAKDARNARRTETQLPDVDISVGCGNCSSTSRCECIEQAINMGNVAESSNSKRAQSPQALNETKRVKQEPDDLETDFTAQFSTSRPPLQLATTSSPTTIPDPCGFCQNGTPCICAEMAAESSEETPVAGTLSQFTPPPSDGDVRPDIQASRDVVPQTISNPCVNGPGTCAQCRSDPNSTLFCKTLAASRSGSASTPACCGAQGGSCCQSGPPNPTNPSSSSTSLRLSCADAYTTLSRHPGYARATDELGAWLPRLHTLPALSRGDDAGLRERRHGRLSEMQLSDRPAMEVEAASVMGVLKLFDRRFGRDQ